MSHGYRYSRGPSWEDLDDEDLRIFAPDAEEPVKCDGCDNVDDAATSAVENVQEVVYNVADDFYDDTPVSLNVANMKYLNEVWNACHAPPAYAELSFDEYCYQPYVRIQYKSNWTNFKECMGVDVRRPMLMKFSPLRLSLTREYDDQGAFTIREAGTLVDGPLFPHAEFRSLPENSETEEEAEEFPCVPGSRDNEEPQMPPRSPPCVPGFRDDDEFEEFESELEEEDPPACHDDGSYAYGSFIRFYCYESGEIVDAEPDDDDDDDDAEECARSTADESTGSSAEDNYGDKLNEYASPTTTFSSVFSDSSEDDACESDATSTSQSEDDDDVCKTLDFVPSESRCIASTEKEQAPTSPMPTTVEGSHTTSIRLETTSNTEITDDTSSWAAELDGVDEDFVSDEEMQTVIVPFFSSVGEVPVVSLPSSGALCNNESAEHNKTEQLREEADVVLEDDASPIEIASPVPVPSEDDITHESLPSTVNIEHAAYVPPAHCPEDVTTTDVVNSLLLVEDAGVSPDFVFPQPPPTTPLVWDVVCTAGFALSSVPWLRIGVATAGLVVDVATTLLRC